MSELTIEIDLEEEGRDTMYERLCEIFSEEEVDETLEAQVVEHITRMFDNREQLQQMENEE